jgi:regulator of replication initiation timing
MEVSAKGKELSDLKIRIDRLEKELSSIKKSMGHIVSEDVLLREWDNEYDEAWNTC